MKAERRKLARKDWRIGRDDVGHAVLEWNGDARATVRRKSDPKTPDLVDRLALPELTLDDDTQASFGRNPYDKRVRSDDADL
jgi:hypothetical protein